MDLQWTIDGKRFRTPEEYAAAKRDKKLIDSITQGLKLDNPKDIEKVYQKLKSGKIEFESIVGRQFDDNIYELHRRMQLQEAQSREQRAQRKQERKEKLLKTARHEKASSNQEKIRLKDFSPDMQKQILEQMRKKERKRKLLVALCIPVCAACFGYFFFYYQAAADSSSDFAELALLKDTKTNQNGSQVTIHRTSAQDVDTPDILPEYETLYNKNKKLIGWLKIDDTVIDYPVMQTANNEYYLNHNFSQEEDKNGCIFADYQCDIINGCDNIILYGHHMQSGKMFGTLNKYSSEEYYKEHPVIQFDTIYSRGKYEVMYVFRSKVYSEEDVTFKYYQFINAGSAKEFDSYMNEMAALSLYDTGVTATYGDKLLTLSTCDYQESDGRFVVVARKIT